MKVIIMIMNMQIIIMQIIEVKSESTFLLNFCVPPTRMAPRNNSQIIHKYMVLMLAMMLVVVVLVVVLVMVLVFVMVMIMVTVVTMQTP